MYENMVDVLIYLYENYMDGESQPPADQDELEDELSRAGFSSSEIEKALQWLDDLAMGAGESDYSPLAVESIRLFSDNELERLDVDVRGLLLSLEQNGILDPVSRELVIERVLAIDHLQVTVDELKWVVLLVLMNRPGREAAFTQMEDLVYNDEPVYLH